MKPADSSWGGNADGLTGLVIERDSLVAQVAVLLAEKARLIEALRTILSSSMSGEVGNPMLKLHVEDKDFERFAALLRELGESQT